MEERKESGGSVVRKGKKGRVKEEREVKKWEEGRERDRERTNRQNRAPGFPNVWF